MSITVTFSKLSDEEGDAIVRTLVRDRWEFDRDIVEGTITITADRTAAATLADLANTMMR